jgi:hypothetical protein
MNVLCIDTEPETIGTIEEAGHAVAHGDVGFRSGRPNLPYPPHEFDIVLCDLRRPACFDVTYWGPGKNDNYHCRIEKEITDVPIGFTGGRVRPKFEIIHPGQMPLPPVGTFGPAEVFAAIAIAGVPLILFLNKEWLQHVGYSSPNFSDIWWRFERTKATKLQTSSLMDQVLAAVQHPSEFSIPLEFAIVESAHRQGAAARGRFNTRPLVTNAVSQIFGEVAFIERGTLWAMPQFLDNARFCVAVLDRFEAFLSVQSHLLSSNATLEPIASTPTRAMRDVFISHASEDKAEIARPLAEALIKRGLSVWFDEYELTLGDRLRRKIEEGLKVSRYGVTILSENFFQKRWPQEELDALCALETETKKILPVWHRLSAADITRYAPLMADRIAVSTDKGVDAVADAIVRAVTRQ